MHSGPIRSLCLRLESGKNSPRSIVSRTLFAKSCGMLTFLSNMMFFFHFKRQNAFFFPQTSGIKTQVMSTSGGLKYGTRWFFPTFLGGFFHPE